MPESQPPTPPHTESTPTTPEIPPPANPPAATSPEAQSSATTPPMAQAPAHSPSIWSATPSPEAWYAPAPPATSTPPAATLGAGTALVERAPLLPFQPHPPRSPRVPKYTRVAFPRGVIPATALTGIATAALIPIDRPGIGWLLTGLLIAAAIYTVDRTARRNPPDPKTGPTESTLTPTAATASPLTDSTQAAALATESTTGPHSADAEPATTVEVPAAHAETSSASAEQHPTRAAAAENVAAGAPQRLAKTVTEGSDAAPEPVTPSDHESATGASTPAAVTPSTGSESSSSTAKPAVNAPESMVASDEVARPGTAEPQSSMPVAADSSPVGSAATPEGSDSTARREADAPVGTVSSEQAVPSAAESRSTTTEPSLVDSATPVASALGVSGAAQQELGSVAHGTTDVIASGDSGARVGESASQPGATDTGVADSTSAVATDASGAVQDASVVVAVPVSVSDTSPSSAHTSVDWGRVWWSALALALLAVGTFRAADWLFALCVVAAAAAGSLAIVRRSVYGVFYDMVAVPLAAATSTPLWLYRGVERVRLARMSSNQRVWWSLLVTVLLLMVLVPLLAGADAVFARLVDGIVPVLDMDEVWRWVILFPIGALGTAGALFLLAGPPAGVKDPNKRVARRLSRVEWGIPVGAMIVLFGVFVATQLAVLFGGDGYVQRTAELTYAEYARNGFWQLSIVSMLTLAVIAVVQRWAAQDSTADRTWLRAALAAVCVLTLVIVASALSRMWTYQQAYGFTTQRLLVEVFELWIAALYLLVLASLVRLRRHWLPRAAVAAGAATLLGLAILNPDRFVADRNIDRWATGEKLDIRYLSRLSTDALPAADRLPEPLRQQVVGPILKRLDDDPWRAWNLSRSSAR